MVAVSFGDEVTVKFKGKVKRVETVSPLSRCMVVQSDDSGFTHAIYAGADADFEVTRKTPSNWPPEDGDVWRTDSNGLTFHTIGSTLYRKDRYGTGLVSRSALDALKNSPDLRLVHRRH